MYEIGFIESRVSKYNIELMHHLCAKTKVFRNDSKKARYDISAI